MSIADHNHERIIDALEHARSTRQLAITKINDWPTAPHESPVIAVTTTETDGRATKTTITLETDGRGIYCVEGPIAEIRDSIRLIAEKAIA